MSSQRETPRQAQDIMEGLLGRLPEELEEAAWTRTVGAVLLELLPQDPVEERN